MESRVLVLMPTGRDAHLVCETLEKAGIIAEPCADAAELAEKISVGAGAILLAEEALPSGTMDFSLHRLKRSRSGLICRLFCLRAMRRSPKCSPSPSARALTRRLSNVRFAFRCSSVQCAAHFGRGSGSIFRAICSTNLKNQTDRKIYFWRRFRTNFARRSIRFSAGFNCCAGSPVKN